MSALLDQFSECENTDAAPLQQQNCVFPIADYADIYVEGVDAEKFLQGQLTCDVTKIDTAHSSRGAHCNPKGRAIASFVATRIDDHCFGFKLPEDNIDNLAKSLGKYIVFSKAKISTQARHVFVGICGPKAKTFVEKHFGPSSGNTSHSSLGIAISHSDETFELWIKNEQIDAFWPVLTELFTPKATIYWQQKLVSLGIVDIRAETADEFIPQMFGLKENDGISYKKGCYTGQEIVARLHFLGQQKRLLAKFTGNAETHKVNDTISSSDGKNLGTVIAVAGNIGLAVVNRNAFDADTAHIEADIVTLESLDND